MASHTLILTWPDGDGTRVLKAMQEHYGQVEDPEGSGIYRDMTVGETLARYDQSARESMTNIVLKYEQQVAAAAAIEGVEPVPIT